METTAQARQVEPIPSYSARLAELLAAHADAFRAMDRVAALRAAATTLAARTVTMPQPAPAGGTTRQLKLPLRVRRRR